MRRVAWIVLLLAVAGCRAAAPPPRSAIGPFAAGTWQSVSTAPLPRHLNGALIPVDGRLVAFAGSKWAECPGWGCPVTDPLHAITAYDPETDTWQKLARMPGCLCVSSALAIDGDHFFNPGYDGPLSGRIRGFDLSQDRWRIYPSPPIEAINIDHMVAHGHFVDLTTLRPRMTVVQRLDLRTLTWRILPRIGLGEMTIRLLFWTSRGLVAVGYDSSSGTPVRGSAVYVAGRWRRDAELQADATSGSTPRLPPLPGEPDVPGAVTRLNGTYYALSDHSRLWKWSPSSG